MVGGLLMLEVYMLGGLLMLEVYVLGGLSAHCLPCLDIGVLCPIVLKLVHVSYGKDVDYWGGGGGGGLYVLLLECFFILMSRRLEA